MFWFMPWELAALVKACGTDLVDPAFWFAPDGYCESLALCIIDSIFATGQHYHFVVKLIGDFREHRRVEGGNADIEGVRELLASFDQLGGPLQWAAHFAARQGRISTRDDTPLRAETAKRVAHGFAARGVWTIRDLRQRAADGSLGEVEQLWRSIPGQRSGATWSYFLMLASVHPYHHGNGGSVAASIGPDGYGGRASVGINPDRMIIRYVARALGLRQERLDPNKAAALVATAAWWRGWAVNHLNHVIWRFESSRTTYSYRPG